MAVGGITSISSKIYSLLNLYWTRLLWNRNKCPILASHIFTLTSMESPGIVLEYSHYISSLYVLKPLKMYHYWSGAVFVKWDNTVSVPEQRSLSSVALIDSSSGIDLEQKLQSCFGKNAQELF